MNSWENVNYSMKEKVREVYDCDDKLVMVATDRISAFDHILKNKVTEKGAILTQMSKFWFDYTKDVVANHMVSVDVNDMPEFFHKDEYIGRSMLCKKLTMLPVECIVRGYITGSGWASYKGKRNSLVELSFQRDLRNQRSFLNQSTHQVLRLRLATMMRIFHLRRVLRFLKRSSWVKGLEYANKIKDATITLYKKCAEYALSKGIIIADTKFEFGLDENGEVVIGDEMLTPDSSRFWPLEGYEAGKGQPSYDKQFVRDWLKANPDSDYLLPDEVVIEKTVEKYKEAYELLTGKRFFPQIITVDKEWRIMNQIDINDSHYAEDELHEECGVFGVYDFDGNDVSSTIYYGLFALQHRGQESCGIAVSDTNGPKGKGTFIQRYGTC